MANICEDGIYLTTLTSILSAGTMQGLRRFPASGFHYFQTGYLDPRMNMNDWKQKQEYKLLPRRGRF